MKIRNGFVSNSSSSSFTIYGLYFDSESEVEELRGLTSEESDESKSEDEDEYGDCPDYYEIAGAQDLQFNYVEGSGYFFGISWTEVKDDETGLQFKQRVKASLSKLFPKITEKELENCCTYSETYYC